MELDEFIKKTILHIQTAVKESKNKDAGMRADLPVYPTDGKGGVEFDLSIDIIDDKKIVVVGKHGQSMTTASRLRFTIPIVTE